MPLLEINSGAVAPSTDFAKCITGQITQLLGLSVSEPLKSEAIGAFKEIMLKATSVSAEIRDCRFYGAGEHTEESGE
jgi:hypothetical protein